MYLDFRRKVFGLIRPYQQKRLHDVELLLLLNRVTGSPQRANRVAEAGWGPVITLPKLVILL